jgi:hypothetical protein
MTVVVQWSIALALVWFFRKRLMKSDSGGKIQKSDDKSAGTANAKGE